MPCILPQSIKDLRRAITEQGGFAALRAKTAQERIDFFKQYVDTPGSQSTAEWLNREIERRVLKPGQISATKDWMKRLEKKKLKITNKKALLDRIMDKKDVFNPKSFYAESLVKQALGFETGRENAKSLFDKAKTVNAYRKKLLSLDPKYLSKTTAELKDLPPEVQQAREELGKQLVDFQHLYESINLEAQTKLYKTKGFWGRRGEDLLKVAGNIKSMKASFDVSFLRQLQSTGYVHKDSFVNAMKAGYSVFFGTRGQVDTLMADLLTRPNALAGRYNDFGVEVGIKEEAFPESWISKVIDKKAAQINLFARSEEAFNVAIQTARADLFDWMWERSNGDVKLLKEQEVGKAINTITGRGQFPILTSNDPKQNRIVNNLLFAPKWLASRIQTFTDLRYAGQVTKMSPEGIRARAAIGNAIVIASIAALKSLIWATGDDDKRTWWEMFDPRSADFGKIVIGRTRYDLTAGTASLITLVSRLGSQATRTSTGAVRPIKTHEILGNFLKGKSSPGLQLASQIVPLMKSGQFVDYRGKPLKWDSPQDWTMNIAEWLAPITLTSAGQTAIDLSAAEELGTEEWAEVFGVVADFIGIGSTTYDKK